MQWYDFGCGYNPVVIKWETKTAKFLQIELSPSHVLRVKMDKDITKKGVS